MPKQIVKAPGPLVNILNPYGETKVNRIFLYGKLEVMEHKSYQWGTSNFQQQNLNSFAEIILLNLSESKFS